MTNKKHLKDRNILPIMGIALFVVIAAMLIEMSFQLSRASFFSKQAPLDTVIIAINALAVLLLPTAFLSLMLKLLLLAVGNRLKAIYIIKMSIIYVFSLITLTIASSHLNTWTYSVFGRDVTSLHPLTNWIVLLSIPLLGLYLTFKKGPKLYCFFNDHRRPAIGIYAFSFLFLIVSATHGTGAAQLNIKDAMHTGKTKEGLPNIVLFSSDGMDKNHMSLYGYERETTPTMDKLGKRSIIYTRAYSNANNTRGSIVSVLTGKTPLTTKVIYPPDILTGEDAFQHLPGILANLGYYCITFDDAGEYLSAKDSNMQLAFHNDNGEESLLSHIGFPVVLWASRQFHLELFHIAEIVERPVEFIGYLTGLSKQLLHSKEIFKYLQGAGGIPLTSAEETTFKKILARISDIDRPIFMQVHSAKSHGPRFLGVKNIFSAGIKRDKKWNPDFYDDAILHADYMFWLLLKTLEKSGKLENTMIVIYTDHSNQYRTFYFMHEVPLPLLVHLPGQRTKKMIDKPVQYLDLLPSILSYMGIKPPDWAEGEIIFPSVKKDLENRPIFSFSAVGDDAVIDNAAWVVRNLGPSYYNFKSASVLKNGFIYKLDLQEGKDSLYNTAPDAFRTREIISKSISKELGEILLRYLQEKKDRHPGNSNNDTAAKI